MTTIRIERRRASLRWAALAATVALATTVAPAGTLPRWTGPGPNQSNTLELAIPAQIAETPPRGQQLDYLILKLDKAWSPDWQKAAFDLKNLIVEAKTQGPDVLVGIEGSEGQINRLMAYELAAYVDGYVFEENPFIPNGDPTGKLWLRAEVSERQALRTLVDAASLGIEAVLFSGFEIDQAHQSFLETIDKTPTGSLDLQPEVTNTPQEEVQFFFDPGSGNYHLAAYGQPGQTRRVHFSLARGLTVTAIEPATADFEAKQYGRRTEIELRGGAYYFFLLEPAERSSATETLKITATETIDPYELVVKNQVFKDKEDQKFRSLQVDELSTYRYQAPNGIDIDVSFDDTVVIRKGAAIERLRRDFYFGGVKWPYDKLPELPLIQPEKVQSAPLEIDLDKSYRYSYEGVDQVDGFATWKVRFQPGQEGKYFAGTVWIDQETGAHRKIRAIQFGLEPPISGNEKTVYFDWVEDGDERFWTQVREESLQVLTIAGLRLALQIDSARSNFRFNRDDVNQVLSDAYASELTILRDTDKGFRYLKKKGGERVLSENTFDRKKAILGGVLYDPALDNPTPLAGFNYTDLDFLNKGYQANFFVAGAINDLIVSDPDFLDKGWDFTVELFLSALYFGDSIYEGDEERVDLEVEELRESFNATLGIPLNSFFKITANYGLRYLDYQEGDDTDPNYVLPVSTFENIGRLGLQFSRERFVANLELEYTARSDWETFGLPGAMEPVQDSYRKAQLDFSYSKRLAAFQTLAGEVRYLKGWDLDRFSRFGFGFFENRVAGFGTSGVKGDEALRLSLEYEAGVSGLFGLDISLDGARAWRDSPDVNGIIADDEVDLAGLGLAVNFVGPWRTLLRLDVGYGFYSSLDQEEGEFNGQIVFLKLF